MNIITRHILNALSLSFLISLSLSVVIFFAFPLSNWSMLWEKRMMDFPFLLFFLSLLVFLGVAYGLISGLYWRRQLKGIGDELYLVGKGRSPKRKGAYPVQELASISKQISVVHKHVIEQKMLSQKLANEKAEDQEKQIQEIVSRERNRLARELHDSVSQQLFAASMLMSAITEPKQDSNNADAVSLRMVEGMLHQSQLEMRALLLHLRPVPLHGKSLQEGIQDLLTELLQKVSMKVSWNLEPIPLDKGIEDHLFRILQESISNTLRHAKATLFDVLLIERDGLIIFRIVDDGVGFDSNISKTGSYGLQNMHERAIEIGGSLKVVSVLQKGTRLEVKIPMLQSGGFSGD